MSMGALHSPLILNTFPSLWPSGLSLAQRHCPNIHGFWVWFPAGTTLACSCLLILVQDSLNSRQPDLKFRTLYKTFQEVEKVNAEVLERRVQLEEVLLSFPAALLAPESPYVAQVDLELAILLSQPSLDWDPGVWCYTQPVSPTAKQIFRCLSSSRR